jgi:hypothetical protein
MLSTVLDGTDELPVFSLRPAVLDSVASEPTNVMPLSATSWCPAEYDYLHGAFWAYDMAFLELNIPGNRGQLSEGRDEMRII